MPDFYIGERSNGFLYRRSKLSVNGKTINKLTMRLPIYKIMQAQVLERYQRQGQSKKDEQALVALKLNKPSKNADPKSLYKIAVDDKANPRAAVKYL